MKKKVQVPDGYRLQQRAIKYRIFPFEQQSELFAKTFGCTRFIWNKMLDFEQQVYDTFEKHFIPTPATFKKEYPFLKEVDSLALANTQLDLQEAFSRFFKDPKAGFPNFKSKKKARKSYTTNNQSGTIALLYDGIKLPKVGVVKAKIHRKPKEGWALKSATVSQSSSGKYYCSLLFEYIEEIPKNIDPAYDKTVGLDYSSPDFYVDDKGFSPKKERYFRALEDKLAREQRKLSKMVYGSNNYWKQKHKVDIIHEHIANQRKDFCHKESRRIANSYDAVCVEDLNLKALAQSLNLGTSTLDNGFGMFRTFLKYKLEEQGKHFIVIDKWFPSSKTCNHCGYVNKMLTLRDRVWICPDCGTIVIRDANAGKNIKERGLDLYYGIVV